MLRRTHVYKSHDLVSLLASFNSTPVEVLDRTGYSIVADWAGGSTTAKSFVSGVAEVTDVTCVADVGSKEVGVVTFPAVAALSQGDYAVISNVAGTQWVVWFDIDASGVVPTGAAYTVIPPANRFMASVATGDLAPVVAAAAVTALGTLANITILDNTDGTVTFTQTKTGNPTNITPHNTDDSGAGSLTVATTPGVASNLNNKYFTIQSALNAVSYYVWFNVNGEGVDPAVAGKTAVPVAITYGSQADTDVAAALDAVTIAGTSSAAVGATVTFTNAATGATTNAADGTAATGFTFLVTTQGVTTQVNQTDDQATVTTHGLVTGAKVALTTTTTLPAGLVTPMYVIVIGASTLKFATTLANAIAGTAVDITSDGTGTHTVTPTALSGTFKLQASNDYNPKINPVLAGTWSDITGSSVVAAGSGSFGWNVSDAYYAWVRLVWTFADGTGTVSASTCVKD